MKLKKEHFELFEAECEKWLKKLGLISWDVTYAFKPMKDCHAEVEAYYSGRCATIWLNTEFFETEGFEWTEEKILKEVKGSALHEVLELLLSPLTALAKARTFDRLELDQESHIVVRTLENVLVGALNENL